MPYFPPTTVEAQYTGNTRTFNAITRQPISSVHPSPLPIPPTQTQLALISQPISITFPPLLHHQVQFTNPTLPLCQPESYVHPQFNRFSTQLPFHSLQTALTIFSHPGSSSPLQAHPISPQPPTIPT